MGEELAGRMGEVQVPATTLVRCPLVEFKLRAVARCCPGCEHFRGMQDRYPGRPIAFE